MLDKLKAQLEEQLKGIMPKIEELRSKIPLSFLKKKVANEELVEDQVDKTEQSVSAASADKTSQVSEGEVEEAKAEAESAEEGPKEKAAISEKELKKKKIIKIAVVVGLVYLGADTFLNDDQKNTSGISEEIAANKETKTKTKKEIQDTGKTEKEAEVPQVSTNKETVISSDQTIPDSVSNTAAPDKIVDITTPKVDVPAVETNVPVAVAETPAVENKIAPLTPEVAQNPVTPSNPPSVVVEVAKGQPTSSEPLKDSIKTTEVAVPSTISAQASSETLAPSPSSISPANNLLQDQPLSVASVPQSETKSEQDLSKLPAELGLGEVQKKETSPTTDNSMESKILDSEKEYIIPEYNQLGRGLVYNCKGKHWACVNRENYFKCRDNEKWVGTNNKSKECKPVDVYASDTDCKLVQINNINIRKETSFCN